MKKMIMKKKKKKKDKARREEKHGAKACFLLEFPLVVQLLEFTQQPSQLSAC
jgi:hypothetical protein